MDFQLFQAVASGAIIGLAAYLVKKLSVVYEFSEYDFMMAEFPVDIQNNAVRPLDGDAEYTPATHIQRYKPKTDNPSAIGHNDGIYIERDKFGELREVAY